MNKLNSIKTHSSLNLSDQKKFKLNEINKIKDYFNFEIQERKTMSKNKINTLLLLIILTTLIVLSLTSGGTSIISFTSVIGISLSINRLGHKS